MQAMVKIHKFGLMKCKKCGHRAELFGNLDSGMFKYCCTSCHDKFYSDKFYIKSLIK